MATIQHRKSSVLTDEDLSVHKAWKLDTGGIFKNLQNLGEDVYDHILEAVQNAIDSARHPLTDPNTVSIIIPPRDDSRILRVEDWGEGLTKKHDRIEDFMEEAKGHSTKSYAAGDTGQFGIGMTQYGGISYTAIFRSQDTEMVYYLPSRLNEDGVPEWLKHRQKPISSKWQDEFGIHHKGTIVDFYDPKEDGELIESKKLSMRIRESFGMRMIENKKLIIMVNNTMLDPPPFLKG